MKKYCFRFQKSYGEEILFFEDEQGNAIIMEANSPEEAENLLAGMVNDEYVEVAKEYSAWELPAEIMNYPFEWFVEWRWSKELPISEWYGKPQMRSDFDEHNNRIN